jgi:hypothetical protein
VNFSSFLASRLAFLLAFLSAFFSSLALCLFNFSCEILGVFSGIASAGFSFAFSEIVLFKSSAAFLDASSLFFLAVS